MTFLNIIKAFGSKEPFKKAFTYDLALVPEVPLLDVVFQKNIF